MIFIALPFQIDHETIQAVRTAEMSGLQILIVPIHHRPVLFIMSGPRTPSDIDHFTGNTKQKDTFVQNINQNAQNRPDEHQRYDLSISFQEAWRCLSTDSSSMK